MPATIMIISGCSICNFDRWIGTIVSRWNARAGSKSRAEVFFDFGFWSDQTMSCITMEDVKMSFPTWLYLLTRVWLTYSRGESVLLVAKHQLGGSALRKDPWRNGQVISPISVRLITICFINKSTKRRCSTIARSCSSRQSDLGGREESRRPADGESFVRTGMAYRGSPTRLSACWLVDLIWSPRNSATSVWVASL
jgi:hypothetical protein